MDMLQVPVQNPWLSKEVTPMVVKPKTRSATRLVHILLTTQDTVEKVYHPLRVARQMWIHWKDGMGGVGPDEGVACEQRTDHACGLSTPRILQPRVCELWGKDGERTAMSTAMRGRR